MQTLKQVQEPLAQKGSEKTHEPVMVSELLSFLIGDAPLKRPKKIIDATLGLGGHTKEFLRKGAFILGIETDLSSLKIAENNLKLACPPPDQNLVWGSYKLVHGNFKDIGVLAKREEFTEVDGILFDLGLSSFQLTSDDRGFSFREKDTFLDMRMDPDHQAVTARDLINGLRLDQLIALFEKTLSRQKAQKLARLIEKLRQKERIEKVGHLVNLIEEAIGAKSGKLNKATLPFLALRMAVNAELENLKEALPSSFELLKKGGKLAVISFHSGEDAVVKEAFYDFEKKGAKLLTKKPFTPTFSETQKNKRARSAKLRVIQKI